MFFLDEFFVGVATDGHISVDPSSEEPTGVNSSRETIVSSIQQPIIGKYHLLDLLSLKSVQGRIDVSVVPEPGPSEDPHRPAELRLATSSGVINTEFQQLSQIPHRDYLTSVNSANGQLLGTYVAGTSTTFHTDNGGMVLTVYAAPRDSACLLNIDSQNGKIKADVRPLAGDRAVRNMASHIKTINGAMTLRFQDFEGTIRARTVNGAIKVGGSGLIIRKDERDHAGHRLFEAVRGAGHSTLDVESINGAVDIFFT